ncbi:divalent-cation tolerance protein CutA [Acidisphaera rubrifaciens]|uniref:Divalent cation tolerance protein n=1 Tax=Acidisphaera rubrifaciens HS-AP3 TaxID=1231350 RepID=A0A0D6P3N0_9PROT|nr:divalent-cation tolerance protein CutA [Acidisphaera rubrifaciens]GAN75951.1 divalent cation tolerance protein [Acidisphaera rubrifaciens HS-AP3]
MADIVFVYVTCADADEARRIGRTLVEERLAACVNLRAHETIYRWQGAIESGPEWALIAKTTRAAFARLRDRVAALHSYTVPCIVAVPVADGLAAYLDWVGDEVGG